MRKRTGVLLLILVGLVVYFSSLSNDFFISDDEDQIINNLQIRSVQNIPQLFFGSTYYRIESNESFGLYYRPLMLASFSFLYQINGADPFVFHAFQLAIHIVNAVLVFVLFCRFFKPAPAIIGALIFLIHPINSEAVLHSANLQDVLFLFFGMSAILLYGRTRKKQTVTQYSVLSILLLLSLFSKEVGIVFIGMALVYVFLFDKKDLKSTSVIAVFVTSIYAFFRFILAGIGFQSHLATKIANAPFITRLIHIPKVLFSYLFVFFFPQKLRILQFWMIDHIDFWNFVVPIISMGIFFSLLFFAGFRIHKKNPYDFRLFVFFLIWFMSGFAIHSHIIPLEQTVAERWFYFPIIGLVGLFLVISRTFLKKRNSSVVFIFLVVVLIVTLAVRTVFRTFNWKDSQTLLEHDLAFSDSDYYLENLYATLLIREKRYTDAKSYVITSVATYPYFGNINNLAIIYLSEDSVDQALFFFKKAIDYGGNYQIYQNYANVLLYRAYDFEAAYAFAKQTTMQYPYAPDMWLVLAQSAYQLGNKKEEALAAARHAYTLQQSTFAQEVLSAIKEDRTITIDNYITL